MPILYQSCSTFKWYSFVFLTTAVCGMILYSSYIYRYKKFYCGHQCDENLIKYISKSSKLTNEEANECPKICESEKCLQMAETLLGNLDESADPCEDFYAFACGNYEKFAAHDDFERVFSTPLETTMMMRMKDILENIKSPTSSLNSKMKTIYDSCISEESSESNAVQTLMEYLEKFGIRNWPHLDADFHFTEPNVYEAIAMMDSYRDALRLGSALIIFTRSHNESQTSVSGERVLDIKNGYNTPLPDSEEFNLLLSQILNYLGVDAGDAQRILQDFNETDSAIRQLDEELNETLIMDINCAEKQEIKDMKALCPALKKFVEFNGLEGLYSSTMARVVGFQYFEELLQILQGLPNERTFANYLALKFVAEHRDHLNTWFKMAKPTLKDQFRGRYKEASHILQNKWMYCVSWTNRYLGWILTTEYVRHKLSDDELNEVRQITNTYASTASYYLWHQTWIEEDERKVFAHRVQRVIHTFDEEIDYALNVTRTWIDEFQPTNESFLKNELELQKHYLRQIFVDKEYFRRNGIQYLNDMFEVNAYGGGNVMALTFGILLPPLYEFGRPMLLNFFTLGNIIGHEIGHGIQTYFMRNYRDSEVLLNNRTMEKYDEKKKCIHDQYSEFEIQGIGKKLRADFTYAENEADVIGIQLSDKIMDLYLEKVGDEVKVSLPAFNYTTRQFAYIAEAQFWCSKLSIAQKLKQYEGDSHAPFETRVLGKALNSQLSKTFHCPEGSKMNQPNKCAFFE